MTSELTSDITSRTPLVHHEHKVIIHHNGALARRNRSKLLAYVPNDVEQRNVYVVEVILSQFL